ncbi:hypothetical protein [Pedobacter frigiditerrae]|uniref:hypothetical protein n=1 Tax=Pedobacter frigiditerrae TaxID=2530452 RepID=UPI00292E25FA|nr:hypothetical protein [Pedobacter frigiditerrae]
MKAKLILSILLLVSITSSAQLTLNETINYIDKKLKETEDLKRTYNDQFTYVLSGLGLGIDGSNKDKVILSYNRKFSDGTSDELQYIFDPTHISDVLLISDTYKDAVGMVNLKFVGETSITKQRINGKVTDTTTSGFTLPYLRTDPLNYERLKKAFILLKQLYAAKKAPDPFAN